MPVLMNRCSKCSLEYNGIYGKSGHCCGHCQGGRGHGKNCTAKVICQGCGNEIEIRRCKYSKYRRSFGYYCCGHCQGGKGGHGRDCAFFGQERSRSRTPQPSTSRTTLQQETSAGAASMPNASGESVCKLCYANPLTHACLPCGHHCLCSECVKRLREYSDRCPVCRNLVGQDQRIYTT